MYEPSRHISSFHVAGFQHYEGATVVESMKTGALLEMELEPDNPHDREAVVLRFEGVKLGYVPKDENSLVSLLGHYGHEGVFEARILQVDPRKDPWKQVLVGLYVRDAR